MLLLLIKAGNWSNLDPVRFFDNISFSRSFQTLRNWHWQIMRISEIETGKVVLSNDTMLTTPNSPPLPRSGVGTLRILDTLYLLKRHFVPWTLCTFSEDTLYLVTSYLLTRHFVPSYKTLRTFEPRSGSLHRFWISCIISGGLIPQKWANTSPLSIAPLHSIRHTVSLSTSTF